MGFRAKSAQVEWRPFSCVARSGSCRTHLRMASCGRGGVKRTPLPPPRRTYAHFCFFHILLQIQNRRRRRSSTPATATLVVQVRRKGVKLAMRTKQKSGEGVERDAIVARRSKMGLFLPKCASCGALFTRLLRTQAAVFSPPPLPYLRTIQARTHSTQVGAKWHRTRPPVALDKVVTTYLRTQAASSGPARATTALQVRREGRRECQVAARSTCGARQARASSMRTKT